MEGWTRCLWCVSGFLGCGGGGCGAKVVGWWIGDGMGWERREGAGREGAYRAFSLSNGLGGGRPEEEEECFLLPKHILWRAGRESLDEDQLVVGSSGDGCRVEMLIIF